MTITKQGSDEWKDRVSKSTAQTRKRQRETARINLPEVRRYRREGLISPSMLPLAKIAEDEVSAIFSALGGAECVSEQERALVEDFARVGVVLRAELSRYLAGERAAGTRVGTLAGIRRASLVALGLGRRAKEIGLEDYIEAKGEGEES
jgi:hypothetical protein